MKSPRRPHEQLPLFVMWSEFVPWLFNTVGKFPKRVRISLSSRLENLSLDILEKIVEACYSKERHKVLFEIDMSLEKMRVLLRMAHLMAFLATRSYEHATRELINAGKQIGGWRKQNS